MGLLWPRRSLKSTKPLWLLLSTSVRPLPSLCTGAGDAQVAATRAGGSPAPCPPDEGCAELGCCRQCETYGSVKDIPFPFLSPCFIPPHPSLPLSPSPSLLFVSFPCFRPFTVRKGRVRRASSAQRGSDRDWHRRQLQQ